MAAINFFNDESPYRLHGKRAVAAWLLRVIEHEGFAAGDINYVFCSREKHLEMNISYLGHDWPTDVITFELGVRSEELGVEPASHTISGDIFIDPQTVRENAVRFGATARQEMLRVIVHGVLHLCGHPDKAPAEEAAMHALEDKYLALYSDKTKNTMKIEDLKPQLVWKHFHAICAIPHPSHHEEKIRAYVVDFAKKQGLECTVDAGNNVLVRKPATAGMEGRKTVVLQSHLDMVPQKNGDKVFDFEKDAIETVVDGEWVTANGTTLGADNGIGAAATLAVLESTDLKHGAIEALFTATEETGMDGAFGLRAGELKGDILLNLDSETEGELYVGCAGGLDANITFNYKAEQAFNGKAVDLEVKGLRGGHSGMEIVLQRANANKLIFRFLRMAFEKYDITLASVDGGGLRNAIPREGVAKVYLAEKDVAAFKADVAEYEKMIQKEFEGIEDTISIKSVDSTPSTHGAMPRELALRLTRAVCGCPNGVISMSQSMPGLVQTSTNLARVISDGTAVKLQALMRSSVNSEKDALAGSLSSVFELADAHVELSGGYDGWRPNMNSPILKAMQAVYQKLYGKTPEIAAVHAGLECGIIGGKYPDMDMISFGPTIRYPHSPDEKVNIASVGKFWEFLKATLENIPNK